MQYLVSAYGFYIQNSKRLACFFHCTDSFLLDLVSRSPEDRSGGGVAQWLGRRISDQGVPGSNPGRCTFRCGLEQVTYTLPSTG